MKKPDYSDLDAAEGLGNAFGFFAPLLAIIFLVAWAISSFF